MSVFTKPGTRAERLYDWLKKEMVGTELVFTGEHTNRLKTELELSKASHGWDLLRSLEDKGLITRTTKPGEKGIIVKFTKLDPAAETPAPPKSGLKSAAGHRTRAKGTKAKAAKPELTVSELIKKLDGEIARFEAQKKGLDAKIKSKTALREELAQTLRRRS